MIFAEYDYETDIRVKQQEAREEGFELGRADGLAKGLADGLSKGEQKKAFDDAKNLLTMGIDQNIIAKAIGLPLEKVQELAKELE